MSFGIDDILDLVGDVTSGGIDSGIEAGAAGLGDLANTAPAALDVANPAFTSGAPALDVGANVMDSGQQAASIGGPLTPAVQGPEWEAAQRASSARMSTPFTPSPENPTDTFAAGTGEPNPNTQVTDPGVGKSGTTGTNTYEQPSMQTSNAVSGQSPMLQPSPAESFRKAVGDLPGKWYDAFAKAPADIANYAGEHPFKTGAMLTGLGAGLYNMSNQPGPPQAPTFNFPRMPAPPEPALPKPGPPQSPLLAHSGPGTRGRGGMNVGM